MNKGLQNKVKKNKEIITKSHLIDSHSYKSIDLKDKETNSWNSFKSFNKNKLSKDLSTDRYDKNNYKDIKNLDNNKNEFDEEYFDFDQEENAISRRNFLKIFGGITALAGFNLAGCRRPEAFLTPYTEQPEWVIPGKALLYATNMPHHRFSAPMVVTSHEGRPTYIKSNTLHPDSSKGLDAYSQASIYDLYQPDRSKRFLKNGKNISTESGYLEIENLRKKLNLEKSAVLVNRNSSPSNLRIIKKLQTKYKNVKWYYHDQINLNNQEKANKELFGNNTYQFAKIKKAKRIVSIDCDFLGSDQISNTAKNDFSQGRKAEIQEKNNIVENKDLNRLYILEPSMSVTGGMADHRYRISPSEVAFVIAAIAQKLGITNSISQKLINKYRTSKKEVLDRLDGITNWITELTKDIEENINKSIILLGSRYDTELHILVAEINNKLNSFGNTIEVKQKENQEEIKIDGEFSDLIKLVDSKGVDQLVSISYLDIDLTLPRNINFSDFRKKIKYFANYSYQESNNAINADLHIPASHYLESWGDVRSSDGTYGITQPLISPLFGGFSELAFLLALESDLPLLKEKKDDESSKKIFTSVGINDSLNSKEETLDYLFVKETFNKINETSSKSSTWGKTLKIGYLKGSEFKTISATPGNFNGNISSNFYNFLKKIQKNTSESDNIIEVNFTPDNKIWDGRYYNNTQLQEAPDPITKLTWDNAALVSITTAKKLGLYFGTEGAFKDSGDTFSVVKLTFFDKNNFNKEHTLEIPVIPAPGHDDNTLSISLGYGQKLFSAKCSPECSCCGNPIKDREKYGGGWNVYPYLSKFDCNLNLVNLAKIEKIKGKTYKLALTQEHNTMEGRAIAREGTLDDYKQKVGEAKELGKEMEGSFGQMQGIDTHIPPNIPIYKPNDLNGDPLISSKEHQWGMTIDLNTCIGCNSCLLACQSENNIPVVGKDQVIKGREMHWIRTDRYFSATVGREDEPEVITQPVACQQCEFAPCEVVCPVNATVHSPEGLNLMAYNRCIGTRYCANNCPYKVRRFNYFDFNKRPFNQLYKGPLAEKKQDREIEKLGKNPNVSVRMRGVMEKCTYCIQRIQSVKIVQKVEARASDNTQVKENSIKVACQESCEFDAINFGNLLNKKDEINSKLYKKSPRNYDLLKYLGVEPRTSFLARVKNPNPKMPYSNYVGKATINIH